LAVTVSNIIIGAGNLYISATSIPLEIVTDLTNPPLNNFHVGATMDGVELQYEPNYIDVNIDQFKDAAKIFDDGFRWMVRTTLAEGTLENLKVAWNMADSQLVTTLGTKTLSLPIKPDTPGERKLLVLGRSPSGTERRYYARRAIAVEASNHSLKRAEATVFPVTFRILPDPVYSNAEYGFIKDF
jgi:hypothetical protein